MIEEMHLAGLATTTHAIYIDAVRQPGRPLSTLAGPAQPHHRL
jgi:hypothetical protein